MLSTADLDLVRRETHLPHLATILNPDLLLEKLKVAIPNENVTLEGLGYLRYKPGTSCLASGRARRSGVPFDFSVTAFREGGAKLPAFPPGKTPSEFPLLLDGGLLLITPFPLDRKLRTLPDLMDPMTLQRMLTRILPDHPELHTSSIHQLRHKPERRFVARLDGSGATHALLKHYEAREFHAAQSTAGAFSSRGPLSVPQLVGKSVGRQVIVTQWLPGQELRAVLREANFDSRVVMEVGAALAELHAQAPRDLHAINQASQAEAVQAAAKAIGSVLPHLFGQASQLADRVARALEAPTSLRRAAHGDFSAEQVLVGPAGVGIVDFDAAGYADSTADLGSFIARLEWERLMGCIPASRAREARNALLEGYALAGGHWAPHALTCQITAHILRLGPHPFRQRLVNWAEVTELLLEYAEHMLFDERTP